MERLVDQVSTNAQKFQGKCRQSKSYFKVSDQSMNLRPGLQLLRYGHTKPFWPDLLPITLSCRSHGLCMKFSLNVASNHYIPEAQTTNFEKFYLKPGFELNIV